MNARTARAVAFSLLAWSAAGASAGQAPAAAGAPAKPPPRPKPFLVVTFDVEDYTTPAAVGMDDIPKWLAEIMTEEGVTGTFFVIGEKARSLETRGRRDVIAAMARHDIGSHTSLGSVHPTVAERLEKGGWDEGVRTMLESESAGLRDLERIFSVPVRTLARHGGSYGPQLVAALGELGAGYQGSPASLPGCDVVWFCNALNFSAQYAPGFDDAYYRDELFEPLFDKLKADLPGLARTSQVLALFGGHPTKIRSEQFWDFNFYGGRNTPAGEWKTPALRPLESMATAKKNFRRMVRLVKECGEFENTSYRALMDLYAERRTELTAGELEAAAAEALRTKTLAPGEDFSPAEAFAGLAVSLVSFAESGSLPRSVKIEHPFGPFERPPLRPEIERASLPEVLELARQARDVVRTKGALPAALAVGKARLGTGSLFALFAAAYLDLVSGKPGAAYTVPAFEPYPAARETEIIREVESYKTWPVHRPELDMSRIAELTRLQLWTLKPARPRS